MKPRHHAALHTARATQPTVSATRGQRSVSTTTDDELLVRYAAGETAAFEQVLQRHETYLLALSRRFLRDDVAAHDVAQNTFAELILHIDRYDARGQLRAYLRRIALNQCRMALRASRRIVLHSSAELMGSASFAEQLDARLDVERVMSLIDEPLRIVVERHYLLGLSVCDIACELNLPAGTVKRRLFDARRILRERNCNYTKQPFGQTNPTPLRAVRSDGGRYFSLRR